MSWTTRSSLATILLAVAAWPVTLQGQESLRSVIIVRHGEKASTPKENPPLSPAGEARARALLETLRESGVTSIITTDQLRTRGTAAPLLAALHMQGVVVRRSADPREDAEATAAAVRKAGGTVLVVGHQLTIPMVIAALGGPAVATMCDFEYSNLYILIPRDSGGFGVVRGHFGNPDPPPAPDCRITPVSPP